MIRNKDEITIRAEKNSDGSDRLFLHDLTEFEKRNPAEYTKQTFGM